MSFETDRIFELLPAFLRLKDALEGRRIKGLVEPGTSVREIEDFGPLRTLASLIAREGQIVEEGLDQLYADAFIETCAPWVIPYLGDLLGVRGLADIPDGIDMRARVANALDLRRRKGTLRALEHASADASGWPVYAVEYWKRLVHTQAMRLPHPDMGATVDLRHKPALARIGTPFARTARNVEVRRIETMGGRWNLGNIGIHAWRLRPWSITDHLVTPVGTGRRDFRFHPLRCDARLYARAGIRGGVEVPAREVDMPAPITRAVLAEDPGRFYGPREAIHVRVGPEAVPLDEIRAAHLGDLPGGAGEPDWNRSGIPGLTLIDPELGRVVVDPNRSGPVRLSCHFARPLEVGGGEHARATTIGSIEDGVTVAPSGNLVTAVNGGGGEGSFLFEQSSAYTANGTITVPAGATLRLVATDGHFPTVRIGTSGLTVALGEGAAVELNGLRLRGDALVVAGDGERVSLDDCTLVPGRSLDRNGDPVEPGAPSLEVRNAGASLALTRCITGPVVLARDVDACFVESVLDAGAGDAMALRPAPGAARTVAAFHRCTVRGRVAIGSFAGGTAAPEGGIGVATDGAVPGATSDTIFAGSTAPSVFAEHRQVGCIRFSYVPPASRPPRLFRCVDAPAPSFASVRYADATYMLLAATVGEAIARGAENGGEMGVYNRAAHQARSDNIDRTIEDFLRFGHAAGCFMHPRRTG